MGFLRGVLSPPVGFEEGFEPELATKGFRNETLSAASGAFATTSLCTPSGPVTSPTEATIVTVTVSWPWAEFPSE